jgi:hypothetical protein
MRNCQCFASVVDVLCMVDKDALKDHIHTLIHKIQRNNGEYGSGWRGQRGEIRQRELK